MKTYSLTTAALVALSLTAGSVLAEAHSDGAKPRFDREQIMKRLDTDGDGKLSEEERAVGKAKHLDMVFGRIDSDGNGVISKDEFKAGAMKMKDRRDDKPGGRGDWGGKRPQRATE